MRNIDIVSCINRLINF